MENPCHFSPDRRHRYSLVHRWNPLFGERLIMWIGLNPSTADEAQLETWARSNPRIQELIGNATIRKVIVVPGKLVNFVV